MKYGDKRNYKKIDIFLKDLKGNYAYECSTNWAKSCKEAKEKFLLTHNYLDKGQVKASFAKSQTAFVQA